MKNFKKYYTLNATPEEVYTALTNPFTIKLWTSGEAVMSTEPESTFSLMDGSIEGMNLEFEENKRIVQQWYFGDSQVPSIVTIRLHTYSDGTSVELKHTNIPDESYEEITQGWNMAYFGSLKDFFGN